MFYEYHDIGSTVIPVLKTTSEYRSPFELIQLFENCLAKRTNLTTNTERLFSVIPLYSCYSRKNKEVLKKRYERKYNLKYAEHKCQVAYEQVFATLQILEYDCSW
jgi:hypothetical protein